MFLERLQTYKPFDADHIVRLGELYKFSSIANAEIRFRFYMLALGKAGSDAAKHFAAEAAKWASGLDGSGMVKVSSYFRVFRIRG